MTTFADIDRLAASIAALVTAQDRSSDFWDMEDIAYHLRASKSTAMKWAALPDFPKPIRPPTAGRGLGHPLFLPAEVRKWALGHREGAPRQGRASEEGGGMKWQAWAFVDEHGNMIAESGFRGAAHVWRVLLRWPDDQEIETAKARGCRVVRVTIEEVEG